jgi:hypothetical protein
MGKKCFTIVTILFLTTVFLDPVVADQYQRIGWKDLVKHIEFDDPFAALTMDQLSDLSLVAQIRQMKAQDRVVGEVTLKEVAIANQRLKTAGIDIDGLLARREEIRKLREHRATAVVDELDGRQISMPGYALPLEYSGTKITEFLLVPWVGACIHTPPPPVNQIVYVKSDEGVESKELFIPVIVKGEMSVSNITKDLYLVDGVASIDAGYSLHASAVEPYEIK